MHLLRDNTQFDFMGQRRVAVIVSVVLLVVSVLSLAVRGLELGIDFTGGTLIEVGYQEPADIDKVRQTLTDNGFDDAVT